jgi:hypothetical protein
MAWITTLDSNRRDESGRPVKCYRVGWHEIARDAAGSRFPGIRPGPIGGVPAISTVTPNGYWRIVRATCRRAGPRHGRRAILVGRSSDGQPKTTKQSISLN